MSNEVTRASRRVDRILGGADLQRRGDWIRTLSGVGDKPQLEPVLPTFESRYPFVDSRRALALSSATEIGAFAEISAAFTNRLDTLTREERNTTELQTLRDLTLGHIRTLTIDRFKLTHPEVEVLAAIDIATGAVQSPTPRRSR